MFDCNLEKYEVFIREKYYSLCLVRWSNKSSQSLFELFALKLGLLNLWYVKRGLNIFVFRGALLLFEFKDLVEAKSVFVMELRRIKNHLLPLV